MAEENPRRTRIILALVALFVGGFGYLIYKGGQKTNTGPGGRARCILHGMIYPKYDTQQKSTFSDMIRLHFDVKDPEDKQKCEDLLSSYCRHNVVAEQYIPTKLRGSFKPDTDNTEETVYGFTETCALTREERQ